MRARLVMALVGCALPLYAADADDEKRIRERVKAEVDRRIELRKVALASEASARQMLSDHEAKVIVASEGDLAAARAVIAAAEDRRPKTQAAAAPADGKVFMKLNLPGCDMATVASAWRIYFGSTVTVEERARAKRVVIKFDAASKEDAQKKFVAGLHQHGIHVFFRQNRVVLDTAPE